jgi:prepilin-type N-terminal cleavage/methylation domain-containing protein
MRRSRSAGRAFTLVEVLVAIGIVLLLAGLLFPVVAHARRKGHQAQCVSNLRQLTLAWTAYRSDYEDAAPPSLVALVQSQRVDARVLRCPSDPDTWGWAGSIRRAIASNDHGDVAAIVPFAYTYAYDARWARPGDTAPLRQLAADETAGIAACPCHGAVLRPGTPAGYLATAWDGLVLRARVDGAVRRVHLIGYENVHSETYLLYGKPIGD